jgi:multidrug resistance efflux pump
MRAEVFLHFIIAGGVAGFAVYCASYAFHVWKNRNASLAGGRAGGRRRFKIAFGFLLVVGILLCAGGHGLRYAADRSGRLSAEQIYTVRLPDRSSVAAPLADGTVRKGDVVARFESPERSAKARGLALKVKSLEAEKQITLAQSPQLDKELVRQQQELATERRHLEYSRDHLMPSRDTLERERLKEVADQRDRVLRLEAEMDRLTDELAQAEARGELARRQMERTTQLAKTNNASGEELGIKEVEVKVAAAQISQVQNQQKHAKELHRQAKVDLQLAEEVAATHNKAISQLIAGMGQRLHELLPAEKPLKSALDSDLAKAEQRRAFRLEQLELELKQSQLELAGLEEVLTVRAPFDGQVAFREPAPNNLMEDSPILVLAPSDAMRLRVRLPAREIELLRRSGDVVLELPEGHLERYFPGRLAESRPMANDSGYALAELICQPPPDAVQELAAGKPVMVQLRWVPPLYSVPIFWAGLAMAVVGGFGMLAGGSRKATLADSAAVVTGAGHQSLVPAVSRERLVDLPSMEAGAVAPMLRMLGHQLRENILSGSIDLAVVAATEWALDRHQGRAVKLLQETLGDDEVIARKVGRLATDAHLQPTDLLDRLLRVVRVIGGPAARDRLQARGARGNGHETIRHHGDDDDGDRRHSEAAMGGAR